MQCPGCHSTYWNKPYKYRMKKHEVTEEDVVALLDGPPELPEPEEEPEPIAEFHPLNCDCTECWLSRGVFR